MQTLYSIQAFCIMIFCYFKVLIEHFNVLCLCEEQFTILFHEEIFRYTSVLIKKSTLYHHTNKTKPPNTI